MNIDDKVRITDEFTCQDAGKISLVVRVGDLGEIVGLDNDCMQVRMLTGDYAGYITDVSFDGAELARLLPLKAVSRNA